MIAANAIGGVQIAQTIVAVAVADPANATVTTRNVLGVPFGQLGRASNGAWQAAFSGGYAGVPGQGATDTGWEFLAIAHDAGASIAPEGFTAQRAAGQRRTMSSGTAAVVTTSRDVTVYGNLTALEFDVLEIVTYNRRLGCRAQHRPRRHAGEIPAILNLRHISPRLASTDACRGLSLLSHLLGTLCGDGRYFRRMGLFRRQKVQRTKSRVLYHWRCECGAKPRGGDTFEGDARQLAFLHQVRSGMGHPLPEVYSTTVQVPVDWPRFCLRNADTATRRAPRRSGSLVSLL